MARKKVKLAFIERNAERKASYKKRQSGFLKKASELSTLCDAEIATVIYSSYHNEPEVFPNHDAATEMLTKYRELPELEKSKHRFTQEEFIKDRIRKMEEQLPKIRRENRVKEFTLVMYEVLGGKDLPSDMLPFDLNDLSYVINQNLNRIREAIKSIASGESSASNAPQPIAGSVVPSGTSSEGPTTPLLDPPAAPISVIPSMAPSMVLDGTSFEGSRAPLMAPSVIPTGTNFEGPTTFLLNPPMAPSEVPGGISSEGPRALMFAPLVNPLLVDPSMVPGETNFEGPRAPLVSPMQMEDPMEMVPSEAPSMVPSSYPTQEPPTMFHMVAPLWDTPQTVPSPPISSQMFLPMTPPMDPTVNDPTMDASMTMNNYQNYPYGFPESPGLAELLNWDKDEVMTLLDDLSFDNIDSQDPNHNNNP